MHKITPDQHLGLRLLNNPGKSEKMNFLQRDGYSEDPLCKRAYVARVVIHTNGSFRASL